MGVFMNFRKLITYLTMGTAAAMPLAVAQNPTILQGSYISNVFGNSNFIKNPNAQTNIADVTVSNATVTRSTTTPLVATSEFLVTTSTSTGSATWSTRTFDAGMKGQNCEARFTYRGFSVGSTTAQILQGANVVAQLTLTPSTDPRIASINFPCGDLSSATTFRLQQATASLTGTNEIGGIYIGLATNMANVAQAEFVGSVTLPGGTNCIPTSTSTTYALMTGATNCGTASYTGNLQNFSQDPFGFEIRNLKLGTYQVVVSGSGFGLNSNGESRFYLQDTTNSISSMQKRLYTAAAGESVFSNETFTLEYTSQPSSTATFRFYALKSPSGNASFYGNATNFRISVYRFPSSSELVVTPERQNVFGGVKLQGSGTSNTVTSAAWTKFTSVSTLTRTVFGKAKVESNNDHSITIENMPVGSYYISYTGLLGVDQPGSGSTTYCRFALADSATGGWQIAGAQVVSTGDATSVNQEVDGQTIGGIYTNTSVGTRTFFLQGYRTAGAGRCYVYTDVATGSTISVIPLDQPSNSALYVQGPVLGAQTGAAIPAGYAGYTVESTQTGVTAPTLSNTWYTSEAVTLTPGVWSCYAGSSFYYYTGAVPTNFTQWTFGICSGVNCSPTQFTGIHGSNSASTPNGTDFGAFLNNSKIFNVTSTTTYYISNKFIFTARNGLDIDNNQSYLRCTLLN